MRQPTLLGASDMPEMPNLQKTGKSGLPGFTLSLTPYQIGNYSQIWKLALLFCWHGKMRPPHYLFVL